MQDIVYTTLLQATVFNVSFDTLHLFAPTFVPGPDTQVFLNESLRNSFTPSFDSWTTDRKVVRTSEYQLDIGSAIKANSPNYHIAAHQTAARPGVANKTNNVSVFDHVDVKKTLLKPMELDIPKILLIPVMLIMVISINTEISN